MKMLDIGKKKEDAKDYKLKMPSESIAHKTEEIYNP